MKYPVLLIFAIATMGCLITGVRSLDTTRAANLLRYIGGDLYSHGLYTDSLHAFAESLRLAPEVPQTWNNIATSFFTLGSMDAAVATFIYAYDMDNQFKDRNPVLYQYVTDLPTEKVFRVIPGRELDVVATLVKPEFDTPFTLGAHFYDIIAEEKRKKQDAGGALEYYQKAVHLDVTPERFTAIAELNAELHLSHAALCNHHIAAVLTQHTPTEYPSVLRELADWFKFNDTLKSTHAAVELFVLGWGIPFDTDLVWNFVSYIEFYVSEQRQAYQLRTHLEIEVPINIAVVAMEFVVRHLKDHTPKDWKFRGKCVQEPCSEVNPPLGLNPVEIVNYFRLVMYLIDAGASAQTTPWNVQNRLAMTAAGQQLQLGSQVCEINVNKSVTDVVRAYADAGLGALTHLDSLPFHYSELLPDPIAVAAYLASGHVTRVYSFTASNLAPAPYRRATSLLVATMNAVFGPLAWRTNAIASAMDVVLGGGSVLEQQILPSCDLLHLRGSVNQPSLELGLTSDRVIREGEDISLRIEVVVPTV